MRQGRAAAHPGKAISAFVVGLLLGLVLLVPTLSPMALGPPDIGGFGGLQGYVVIAGLLLLFAFAGLIVLLFAIFD